MTDHLSVGVLISTFNRFDSCVEAARSALRQTHTNLQVFVIDDQSTDPRYATLTSLVSDSRLVYLRLPISSRQATGFPCAGYVRNAGARLFTGDYIAVLDDDDIWLPTKIERQLELMKRHGSEVCCTDGYIQYSQRWDPLDIQENCSKTLSRFNPQSYQTMFPAAGHNSHIILAHRLNEHNYCIHSSLIYSRRLFHLCQMYRHVPNGQEDYTLIRMLANENKFISYLHEPLLCYDCSPRHLRH